MRFSFPTVGKRVDASDVSVSFCPFCCATFWSVNAFLLQMCKRHNKKAYRAYWRNHFADRELEQN